MQVYEERVVVRVVVQASRLCTGITCSNASIIIIIIRIILLRARVVPMQAGSETSPEQAFLRRLDISSRSGHKRNDYLFPRLGLL